MDQSDGLILLWSLAMRKAPEFTFTCQTEITAATFHKFNPKLVIGATYTGQIMIWDTRGKSLPVQKTPPGGKYHSHPIYCLGVNGSTNSNNIISVSNNGLLYTWAGNLYTSAGNALHKPAKKIELKTKKRRTDKGPDNIPTIQTNNNDDLGAICMATSELDNNSVLIGTDDSDIYQVSLNATNNDSIDNIVEVFRKHNGPITSIDMHPGDFHKNSNVFYLFNFLIF
jgi:dynein intermediate chain, cytosolic